MIRRAAVSAAAILFWCSASGVAEPDSRQLTRIQFWSMGTATRISVEFNGDFQYSSARLEKPGRIFFDVPNATFSLDGKTRGLHSVSVNDKFVKQIRVANPASSTMTRVVLDLENEAAQYTASQMKNPNRLMIEVYAAGASPAPADTPSVTASVEAPPVASTPAAPPPVAVTAAPKPKPVEMEAAGAALPAKPNLAGDRTLTRALGLKLKRVVLDPGHGGQDDGTTGRGGLKEKDLVLDLAKRLGPLVQQKLGAEVIYTRETDVFVALERRNEIANEQHADLFLSIHANSSTVRSVTGIETYYLSVNGTKAALEVAARENAASQKTVGELGNVIQQIALTDKLRESQEFAGRIQYALVTNTAPPGQRPVNRGVRRAPFIVLIGAHMPSVLAEVGFLSNPQEEAAMLTDEYRDKLAAALYAGIEAYAQSLSKYQTAAAAPAPATPPPTPAPSAQAKRRVVAQAMPVSVQDSSATASAKRPAGKPSPVRRRRASAGN